MKKYPIASLFVLFLLGVACNSTETAKHELSYKKFSGPTMGTQYNITYSDTLDRNLQKEVDELLVAINQEVSTYIDSSVISQFNQSPEPFSLEGKLYASSFESTNDFHFRNNFGFAKEVYKKTNGLFDPTVMPLVNYWGFGYTEKKAVTAIDSSIVDSLMQLVGFDKVEYQANKGVYSLHKKSPEVQVDFSALAKGYAVDELGRLLESKGVKNYLVDIGGEVRAKGKNQRGEWWRLGISLPEEGADLNAIYSTIQLPNRALATSGNYRNYYKVGETSYAHTINPRTGYPEKSTLLSASVVAESCILADAYATAFMVMGLDSALILANQLEGIEAYLIYSTEDGELAAQSTQGMEAYLQN